MALIVHDVAIAMIQDIKPLVERIGRYDRALAQQIRRSASSAVLNIGEGAYSCAGNQTARFYSAAGSANETRSALKVAAVWGYISESSRAAVDQKLDRMLAMLWGLIKTKKTNSRTNNGA